MRAARCARVYNHRVILLLYLLVPDADPAAASEVRGRVVCRGWVVHDGGERGDDGRVAVGFMVWGAAGIRFWGFRGRSWRLGRRGWWGAGQAGGAGAGG